ncbi:hypothetical protein UZ36_07585, partial [Candidatus Nitromaritima sp. SCGC AAA799-C22]
MKSYLTFLRDYGYTDIPLESNTLLDSDPRETHRSSRQPETDRVHPAMAKAKTSNTKPVLKLEDVRDELGDCTRCKLSGGRKTIVFGS